MVSTPLSMSTFASDNSLRNTQRVLTKLSDSSITIRPPYGIHPVTATSREAKGANRKEVDRV